MKKFLTSLTLLIFLVLSQMQLVHAFDMKRVDIVAHHHSVMEVKKSIFCTPSHEDNESDCAKVLIPDAVTPSENQKAFKTKNLSSLPISFLSEIPP
jgi:hypothetical protein